jgi:hypothetical protein
MSVNTDSNVAAVAAQLEPTEISRLLEGRTDWRICDWQEHCGDAGCPMCEGAVIPEGRPSALTPEDQALRAHLTDQEGQNR